MEPLYQASSIRVYGNSELKMTVMDGDSHHFYKVYSYMFRQDPIYFEFIPNEGFKKKLQFKNFPG